MSASSASRTPTRIGLLAAVLGTLLAAGCGRPESTPPVGKLRVTASIFPLADVARQIGGDDVAVITLLPPGVSAHEFQPDPRQAEQLAASRLLLVVGLGLDLWAERSAQAANRGIAVVRFADLVQSDHIRTLPTRDDNHHESHLGDPHLWLDPVLMKAFVAGAAAAFAQADPPRADAYRRRANAYAAELDRLDADYRRTLAAARRKTFVSFHSAFTYLAARYGLTQAAVFDAHAADIGPQTLERVVRFVKENRVKVVFAEPQFPADKLRWLAEQTGGSVGQLDPIGNPAVPGYRSYLEMMRSNLAALNAALSE